MDLLGKVEIARRTMVLFFVVDTSGSMDGEKINAVNTAIKETIPDIVDVSNENTSAQIKIAVLEFSAGVNWITPGGPVEAEKFHWNRLDAVGPATDLGLAFKALNEKLSTKSFMAEATGSFAPAIFLLSDGEPTDDWESALAELKQNGWFKAAVKVAIAIGEDANKDVLKAFTGSMEAVLETRNKEMLKRMIKFVSVRASKVASKSSGTGGDEGDEAKQNELINLIKEEKEEIAAMPDLYDQEDL